MAESSAAEKGAGPRRRRQRRRAAQPRKEQGHSAEPQGQGRCAPGSAAAPARARGGRGRTCRSWRQTSRSKRAGDGLSATSSFRSAETAKGKTWAAHRNLGQLGNVNQRACKLDQAVPHRGGEPAIQGGCAVLLCLVLEAIAELKGRRAGLEVMWENKRAPLQRALCAMAAAQSFLTETMRLCKSFTAGIVQAPTLEGCRKPSMAPSSSSR